MNASGNTAGGTMSSARDVSSAIAQSGMGRLPSLDRQTLDKLKQDAMRKAKVLQDKVTCLT